MIIDNLNILIEIVVLLARLLLSFICKLIILKYFVVSLAFKTEVSIFTYIAGRITGNRI